MADTFRVKRLNQILTDRERTIKSSGGKTFLAEINPEVAEVFIAGILANAYNPNLLSNNSLVEREIDAINTANNKIKQIQKNAAIENWTRSLNFNKKGEVTTEKGIIPVSDSIVSEEQNEGSDVDKEHRAVLGVDKNATPEEIKQKYREEVKKYHPDLMQDASDEEKAAAYEKTIALNLAFESLYLKEKKSAAGQASTEYSTQSQSTSFALPNIVTDKASGFVKGKIKQYMPQSVKSIGSNLGKKFGGEMATKAVTKVGTQVAAKAGVTISAQIAGTSIPIIGNIAAFIATEILPRIKKLLRKFGDAILGFVGEITGERDRRKQIAYIILAGGGVLMLGGYGLAGIGLMTFGVAAGVMPGLLTSTLAAIMFIPSMVLGVLVQTAVMLFAAIFWAILIIVVGTTLIFLIIQMGALVVPPGGFGTETEMGVSGQFHPGRLDPGIPPPNFPEEGTLPGETLYLRVNKEPSDRQLENNSGTHTVTYTLNITARLSDIQLNSMVCTNTLINANGETSLGQNSIDVNGIHIPAGGSHTVTYTGSIDTSTADTSLVDRCCILASAEETDRGACGTAIVNIGDGPVSCPSGLPIFGDDQYSPSVDPHDYSAADINLGTGGADGDYNTYDCGLPVYSTHAGIFTFDDTGFNDGYGVYTDVQSVCNGNNFKSRYAHLRAVNPDLTNGQYVPAGTYLGLLDDTGRSSACHLHYEFRRQNPDGSWSTYQCSRSSSLPCPY